MTSLQTFFLFATGYVTSRLLLAAELHHDLVRWLLARAQGRVSRVVLGVMIIAFALSTVVPNALTVLALLPVIARLRRFSQCGAEPGGADAPPPGKASAPAEPAEPAEPALYGTLLAMALVYGANLGGIGSLLGSPANLYLLVSLRIYDVPGRESLHFVSWLVSLLPMALLLVLLSWGVLWVTAPSAMAVRLPQVPLLQEDTRDQPPRRRAALRFLGIFGLGWAALLAAGILFGLGRPAGAPATPVLASGTIFGQTFALEALDGVALAFSLGFSATLFAWPVSTPSGRERLLGLRDLTRDVPWWGLLAACAVLGLLLLLAWAGGAAWLQTAVPSLLPDVQSPLLVTFVLVTVTIFATEILNNTTVSTVLFPIAAASAPALGTDPLTAMLGVSLASTCVFMTPVGTPVNALALASLRGLSLRRFLISGFFTNLVAALGIALWLTYVVPPMLGFFGRP